MEKDNPQYSFVSTAITSFENAFSDFDNVCKNPTFRNAAEVILSILIDHIKTADHMLCINKQFQSDSVADRSSYDPDICLAFSDWLIRNMILILNEERLPFFHPSCQTYLLKILELFESKDLERYDKTLAQLIQILHDLQRFADEMYTIGKPMNTYELKCFEENITKTNGASSLYNFQLQPIIYNKPISCEYLQAKITYLLKEISFVATPLAAPQAMSLWVVLLLQLQNGPLDLKNSTLGALESLLSERDLPSSPETIRQLYTIIFDLLVMYFDGSIYTCENTEEPAVKLEKSFSSFLNTLFKTTKNFFNIDIVDDNLIFESFSLMVQLFTVYKMHNIKSNLLRKSVLSSVEDLLDILTIKNIAVPENSCCALLDILLVMDQSTEEIQEQVSLVVKIVAIFQSELKGSQEIQEQHKGIKRKSEKEIKPNSSIGVVSNALFSKFPKVKKVDQKMLNLLDENRLKSDCTLSDLNSIRYNLEIILRCTQTLVHQCKKSDVVVFSDQEKEFNLPIFLTTTLTNICKHNICSKYISIPTLEVLLSILLALLDSQDIICTNSHTLNDACVILSIPWLLMNITNSNNHDLKMGLFNPNFLDSLTLEMFKPNLILKCKASLALLHAGIAPMWRIHLLKDSLVKGDVDSIKLLPMFLHSTGYTFGVSEFIEPIMNLCETNMFEISSITGILNCVMTGNSVLARDFTEAKSHLVLKCHICQNVKTEAKKYEKLNLSWLKTLFFKGIDSESIEIRRIALNSCENFFNHSKISNAVLTTFFKLIEDPDYETRYLFVCCIKYFMLSRNEGFNLEPELKVLVISQLQEAAIRAEKSENVNLLDTLVQSFGAIGCLVDDDLLVHILFNLIFNLQSTSVIILFRARYELNEIASSRGVKLDVLIKKFKEKIGQRLMEIMMERINKNQDPLSFLMELVDLSGYKNIRSFLNTGLIRFILVPLVCKATKEATHLIELLGSQLKISKSSLIVQYFPYIFTQLVCHHEPTESQLILQYLVLQSGKSLEELVNYHFQKLINMLLLRLGSSYEITFNTLANLALQDKLYKGPKPIVKKRDMARFLDLRLLGVLSFYDSFLLSSNNKTSDKKNALESLIAVMNLLGPKYISKVRMKLMGTLRITISLEIKDKNFSKVCCTAWKTFIKSIDIQALGPLLNQVTAILLPLLQIEPEMVADIFKYLIIEKKNSLKSFFKDLYYIPEMKELQEVNEVLKEFIDKPCSQEELGTLMRHSLKGISHESVDVKILALSKLRKLLWTHQRSLHTHFLSKESVDPIVADLISTLLDACKETDPNIRLLISECLGEIGAVDPGRIELKQCSKKQQNELFLSLDEEDFAFNVIQELLHPALAVDSTMLQDCSFYALQELLSIYGCRDLVSSNKQGNALWNRFTPDVQEILTPLLQSRYMPAYEIPKTEITRPICANISNQDKPFETFVTNWTSDLVMKIKQSKPKKVFTACYTILKYDTNVVLYMLPYITFYAIQDASQKEMEDIVLEINTVLGMPPENLTHLSMQVIFNILDYLKRWTHKFSTKKTGNEDNSHVINSINKFLDKISQSLLAKASFHCQAFTRALMHIELYLKSNNTKVEDQLGFLQSLYVALGEPDGVAGVSVIRTRESSFKEQILEHEIKGQLNQAFDCYENAVESDPDNPSHHQGLLRCLMGLDKANTALNYASGLLQNKPEWLPKINAHCVEAAWKLCKWDKLSNYLSATESYIEDWGVSVGKILHCAKENNGEELLKSLKAVRNSLTGPLSAAAMEIEGYQRAYNYMCKLHMLGDIERSVRIFMCLPDSPTSISLSSTEADKILEEWKARRQLVQSSMRCQEPVISLQRVLLTLISNEKPDLSNRIKEEMSQCWILSAKLARKNGYQQRSFGLLEASAIKLPEVFVEKAKLHWTMGDQLQAINILKKGIQEHFSNFNITKGKKQHNAETILSFVKAKLLLTKYSEEAAVLESAALITMYKEVATAMPNWEEGYFHYSKYLDRFLMTLERPDSRADLVKDIIQGYGKSMQHGCKHVYHSMPRMLALWFELGTQIVDLQRTRSSTNVVSNLDTYLHTVNGRIMEFLKILPPYLFLTALPQLISRICHSHANVANSLQNIISTVLSIFPQQAMWMMIAVSKSSYKVRVERCQEIFVKAKMLKPELHKFISDCTRLADKLLELSNKNVSESKIFSIKTHLKSLPKLMEDRTMSKILLPLQSSMSVTLPTSSSPNDHNPFPQNLIYIEGFEDSVEILASLQRPKKITIRGSDGNKYSMMCKPKDDLRKDCRLMEFNNLVNKYLKKDSDTRRRQLHIRTYTVVPLNEECGLIEWVPNLMGLRPIILSIYRDKSIAVMTGKDFKPVMPQLNDSVEKKLEIFKTKLLPRHPSVFADFFISNFPDPTSWYIARLAYARTLAVMSMVGYILGLGDRHGENILIDSTTGETFHVDFNCLFNKGEKFDWPERVPFRLTHNMVDALGPTGYEGIFRQACEATIRVMRNQTDALMSMLKPFIYDPLVEWGKTSKTSKSTSVTNGEITNEKALIHVRDIELRLKGIVKSKNKPLGLPLSIEGQVDYLIQEATDEINLCQMYVGWSAYM